MESTIIYLEVPIPVTFQIYPGQAQTQYSPAYPMEIYDVSYDVVSVIASLDKRIYIDNDNVIESILEHIRDKKALCDENQAEIRAELKEK